jgi:hypothetical protein
VFFGWFNAQQPGGSRPLNSLGMQFGGGSHGLALHFRVITGSNKSVGTNITPHVKGQGKERPIKDDGTCYDWTMSCDPDANNGNGRVEFTVKSRSEMHEEFEGKPITLDLPASFKEEGMTFDRFGMMNMPRPGRKLTVWFDDLRYDGREQDFSKDPNWEGVGNRTTYQPDVVGGANDFGFFRSADEKAELPPNSQVRSAGWPQLEQEHESAGKTLAQLHKVTNNYTLPPDACPTFKALYDELQQMEADLHQHIHLENNILFPRAVELEGVPGGEG